MDGGYEFLAKLDPSGVDVLVLAGDLTSWLDLKFAFKEICSRFPLVVFISGNHEYYGMTPDRLHHLRTELQRLYPNLHWLRQSSVTLNGVRFAGTTLWYPKPKGQVFEDRLRFTDYHYIKEFEPWVYREHKAAVKFLQEEASQADVIITHHLPASVCIVPEYVGSPINHFFCHDLTGMILEKKPPLWFFGHSHTPLDLKVGETRMISNPFGYPRESRALYRERLILDVEGHLRS